jgi:NAD(P)-dependent dehydrogenase (short-subunit alcohol dehydrogenase family)
VRALEEQTVLITGATDGLGRGLAGALAASGATLLLHGRDEARGRQTLAEIEAATGNGGNGKLRWLCADLSSLEEVRELAGSVAGACDRLDAIVNNAGIGTTLPGEGRRTESRDGFELRFAGGRCGADQHA